jgi:hypothetical protein
MGEDETIAAPKAPETERGLTNQAIAVYVVLLMASCVALVLASYYKQIGDLILIIPMIILQLAAIVTDRQEVHVPPLIIVLMVATFFLSFLGLGFRSMDQVGFIASILQGINLMMIGLVVLYALMKGHPSSMNSPMVIFISECVAIAIFTIMKVAQFYVSEYWDPMSPVSIDRLMEEMLGVFLGSLLIGVLFLFDKTQRQFEYLLNTFMRGKKMRGNEIAPSEVLKQEALRLMREGESGKVEFKSTMRVNLETKERDKRMEKAVLKTLVAYLNTDGGVLLVGVDDKGNPRGLAEDDFENTDRMNLHLTHMITNAIGDEFLPYIWFTVLDFDGNQVVMISCDRCKKPVFYREGKTEEFYVRSGPSSIVLTGKSLVNYVSNRSKKARTKILDEARLEGRQRSGSRDNTGEKRKKARPEAGCFRVKSLLLLLERLLGLPEGPSDQEGHDDGKDGDDDSVHRQSGEVVLGSEDGCDGLLDSLVPCQCGHESERCGDERGERLEQLNLELVSSSHAT